MFYYWTLEWGMTKRYYFSHILHQGSVLQNWCKSQGASVRMESPEFRGEMVKKWAKIWDYLRLFRIIIIFFLNLIGWGNPTAIIILMGWEVIVGHKHSQPLPSIYRISSHKSVLNSKEWMNLCRQLYHWHLITTILSEIWFALSRCVIWSVSSWKIYLPLRQLNDGKYIAR